MEVKVFDVKGKATSKTVSLSDDVFGIEPNDHAIYLDVKQHLANRRQGTHKAKERAEIAGSTRKIKKQKRNRWCTCRKYQIWYSCRWWSYLRTKTKKLPLQIERKIETIGA